MFFDIAASREFHIAHEKHIVNEELPIDGNTALKIIAGMYDRKGNRQWGSDFDTYRNDSMEEHLGSNIDPRELEAYKRFVGTFFSQRKRSVKNSRQSRCNRSVVQELPADEISATTVRIQVYDEMYLSFYARKPAGKLVWDDVSFRKEVLSGSTRVSDTTVHRAKKKAIAIMNSRRGFRKKRAAKS